MMCIYAITTGKRRARLPGEFGYGASEPINFIIFGSHAKSYLNIMSLKSLVRSAVPYDVQPSRR